MIGTGYLRAVHAPGCMVRLGHKIVGYDTYSAKVTALSRGVSPFFEPGFEELLQSALATGQLRFTRQRRGRRSRCGTAFICVGTPQQSRSDAADLGFVDEAVQTVAELADCAGLVVGSPRCPSGSAQTLADKLIRDGRRLELAWNRSFSREGMAVRDTLHRNRLVFGVMSECAEKTLREVYAMVIGGGTPYITTDLATAEMVKVAANASGHQGLGYQCDGRGV